MSDTTDLGTAIKDAFLFLEPIFNDTAKLLTVVENAMNRAKLVSVFGSTSVWDRSAAYYGDYGWIAPYLNRIYVQKPESGRKSDFADGIALFISVYFRPECLNQPVVLVAVMKVVNEDPDQFWRYLHDTIAMAQKTGPGFLTLDRTLHWITYEEEESSVLEHMWYKVYPLVEIIDDNAVEKLCDDAISKYRMEKQVL